MKLHLVRIALLLLVALCLPFLSLKAGLTPPDSSIGWGVQGLEQRDQGQFRFVPWGTAAGLALLVVVCVMPSATRR